MAIWSLTKERVEKLLQQIGDKEIEIDTLIKVTKEDIWNKDLDDFINQWRFEIQDQQDRQKKVKNMGRRASQKLKIDARGPAARKRKAQGDDPEDSDFGGQAAKKPVKKPAEVKRVQPKQGLLSHLAPLAKVNQPKPSKAAVQAAVQDAKPASRNTETVEHGKKPSDDVWRNLDGASDLGSDPPVPVVPITHKTKGATVTKKVAPRKAVKSEDEDDEMIIRPAAAAARKPRARAAATKPVRYNALSDSDSNGDDLLFDVGKMVKGIGNASTDQSTSTRPLFSTSMSRPGSSAGLSKKPSSSKQPLDLDGDDTDYSKLAPPPTATKGAAVTAKETVLSDDDVDMDDDSLGDIPAPPPRKAIKPRAKPAPKPVAKVIAAAAVPSKKMPLSPAAKAYAAKKARNNIVIPDNDDDEDSDEVEKVANEILDEDEDEDEDDVRGASAAASRPARRAAAAAEKKKVWDSDNDDDEDEETGDEESASEGFGEDDSD